MKNALKVFGLLIAIGLVAGGIGGFGYLAYVGADRMLEDYYLAEHKLDRCKAEEFSKVTAALLPGAVQ